MKKFLLMATAFLGLAAVPHSMYADGEPWEVWEVFTTENSSLPNNAVFRLAIDYTGRVWMASGGLTYYDHGTWKRFSGVTVMQLDIDSGNNAWCASDLFGGQLTKCDGSSVVSYNSSNSDIPSDWVTGVTVDNNNTVWVACSFTGVGEFDGEDWTTHLDGSIGSGDQPMTHDRNNTIWLGTQTGLYRYADQEWTHFTTDNSDLPENQILSLVCDDDNGLWVGTSSKGLAYFDGVEWTPYTVASAGLPSDNVRSLAIDSSGTLWAGTDAGLASYDGATWRVLTKENWLLPSNTVWSVAVAPDYGLWVGTAAGLLHAAEVATDVQDNGGSHENILALSPNPCTDRTSVRLSLSSAARVELALYTIGGEKAMNIASQMLPAGDHTFAVEGLQLPSGVYYCVANVDGRITARQKLVIRN